MNAVFKAVGGDHVIFPISTTAAARKLGITPSEASVAVRVLAIPVQASPLNGNAKMLDEPSYERLKAAALRLRPAAAAS